MEPRRARPPTSSPLCAAVLALLACGGSGQQELVQTAEQQVIAEPAPPPEARDGEPDEIYYDLTRFDWYRHGEPLMVGGRPYQPSGPPEPTRSRKFTPLGRFQGVTYYTEAGATPPYTVVHVPVAPRYWLPFVLAAPPGPGEAAPTGDAPA